MYNARQYTKYNQTQDTLLVKDLGHILKPMPDYM